MNFKRAKRQLRISFYSEKCFSIFAISGIVKRLRIFTVVFFVSLAFISTMAGDYFYAIQALIFSQGVLFFGYIRGMLLLILPMILRTFVEELSATPDYRVLLTLLVILAVIGYRVYIRVVVQGYFSKVVSFDRNGTRMYFEGAFKNIAPVEEFNKCISVKVRKSSYDIFGKMSIKMISRSIDICNKYGVKSRCLYAGHIDSFNDNNEITIFFYTSPLMLDTAMKYIDRVFKDFAKLDICIEVYDDPEWRKYSTVLKPDSFESQKMYNDYYINYLESKNCDMEKKHKIYYRFKLRSDREVMGFANEIESLGYVVEMKNELEVKIRNENFLFIASNYGTLGKVRADMISEQIAGLAEEYDIELYDWIIGDE